MVTPRLSSSTERPGFVPAKGSNAEWTWNAALHWVRTKGLGQYDAKADEWIVDPSLWSLLLRYAQNYRPGSDPELEVYFPYVAPGPNEFIETPEEITRRIAEEQWNKTFGQNQQRLDQELKRLDQQLAVSADISRRQALEQAGSLALGQEEGIRSSLGQAGSLAATLAQLRDDRTRSLIQSQLEPGRFLERESLTRALAPPTPTGQVPLFQEPTELTNIISQLTNRPESGLLSQIIQNLVNYQPNLGANAGAIPNLPAAPSPSGMAPAPTIPPGTPTLGGKPAPVTLQDFASGRFMPGPEGFSVGIGPGLGGVVNPDLALAQQLVSQGKLVSTGDLRGSQQFATPNVGASLAEAVRNINTQLNQPNARQSAGFAGIPGATDPYTNQVGNFGAPAFEHGTEFINAPSRFITSEGGPELQELYDPTNDAQLRVTPLANIIRGIPGFQFGTFREFVESKRPPIVSYEDFLGTQGPQLSKEFEAQQSGSAVPTIQPVGTVTPIESPPSSAQPQPTIQPSTSRPMGISIAPSAQPVSTAPVYGDEAYQNFPSLQFLLGNLARPIYNQLATGTATGAFGTQVPLAGALNYNKVLDVLNDPLSTAMLQAIYRSASQDLGAEVARARARAPLGNALASSLIRTR